MIVGGQVSLTVGVLSVGGAAAVGTLAGLLAGYYRGVWDTVVLQQGPSSLPESRRQLMVEAKRFDAEIRRAGARTDSCFIVGRPKPLCR